jgi:6-phosphogluconolactonase (cycloisomerase 2 family)
MVNAAKAAIAAVNVMTAVNNPIPAATTFSPTSGATGGAAFTLTVNGSNFVTGSVVQWNGSDRPTAFISASQVSAQVPASDIAVAGTAAITVFNPAPGGGSSNSLTFTIGVFVAARFAYVANSGSNDVSMYTINATTGALAPIAPGTIAAGMGPVSVAVDPSGRFVYVANANSNNVSMYTIDATTGALTSIGTTAAGTGSGLTSVAVDPSGRFAYVANGDLFFGEGNDVSMYTINATTGALAPIAPGTVAAGMGPVSVAADPFGRFAYVANLVSDNVSMYAISATIGALTSIDTPVAAGRQPFSVAVDPSGRFAYAANSLSDNVSMYAINATTGALTFIDTPVAAGRDPVSVAVDPSGRFAYVANEGSSPSSGNVSMYTINATTGALAPIAPGTIAAGTLPRSVAITGIIQ